MRKTVVSWLRRVIQPDIRCQAMQFLRRFAIRKGLSALAEDARKVGVNAIGIGLIGIIVNNDAVPRVAAVSVLLAGVIIWVMGMLLTCSEPDKEG